MTLTVSAPEFKTWTSNNSGPRQSNGGAWVDPNQYRSVPYVPSRTLPSQPIALPQPIFLPAPRRGRDWRDVVREDNIRRAKERDDAARTSRILTDSDLYKFLKWRAAEEEKRKKDEEEKATKAKAKRRAKSKARPRRTPEPPPKPVAPGAEPVPDEEEI